MKYENVLLRGILFFMERDELFWFVDKADAGIEDLLKTEDIIRIEIIDQPILARVISKNDSVINNIYVRKDMGALLDSPDFSISADAAGQHTVLENSGRLGDDPGPLLNAVINAAIGLKAFFADNNEKIDLESIDANTEGILFTLKNEEMTLKKVTGRNRPDLLCFGLFGAGYGRPYDDELMQSLFSDFRSLEEKTQDAEAGDLEMMNELALLYANGDDETDPDPEKAIYWFKKLADENESTGMFNLGLYYARGLGVKQDLSKAVYWMKQASENGDEDGAAHAQVYEKALEDKLKAEAGDPQAQAEYARFLMDIVKKMNQGGPDDFAESVQWAEKSALQGNPDGMWILALAYEHGRGVDQDTDKANELYKKGAELGHAPSMNSLACAYIHEETDGKTKEDAFELFKKAAEMGNVDAMRNLGRCYQYEEGTDYNMKEAVFWYEKYLEHRNDDDLARKVMVYKTLPDFDDDEFG